MSKKIAVFEIMMVVLASFSFAYIISETNSFFDGEINESKLIGNARKMLLDLLDGGLVSAQESLWTCLEDATGTICQEYPSSICNDFCVEGCFPGPREDFAPCELGTCLDPVEGTCSANSPQFACEDIEGQWYENAPAQCNPGCCLIGPAQNDAQYVTEITCNTISGETGLPTEWQPVANEIECLVLANSQTEGACVYEFEFENSCKFTTAEDCLNTGGEFYEEFLCSNNQLNTICGKQASTGCLENKDEVYWFDSCGNRENIYDANRVKSWNEGKVLSKEESCELKTGNNPLAKQSTCGNCNYFLGSICGLPGGIDDDPVIGDYVCKDLSCVDEWGDDRKNGESWCAFDGIIGLDNENEPNNERSVDVPGSRHYRKSCLDGEVRIEPCADFRNEICVENRNDEIGFSSAACRINQRQDCSAANIDPIKLDKCEENTDCSLKSVQIDQFSFDVCTPKYPPGFDLKAELGGQVGESLCSTATQSCTVIEVKSLLKGWECEANCDCLDPLFAETMNNLCMSLGDCGAHVNSVGDYTDDGYEINHEAIPLGDSYIERLRRYAERKEGQIVEPLSGKEIAALFGKPNSPRLEDDDIGDIIGFVGLGAAGVLFASWWLSGGNTGALAAGSGLWTTSATQSVPFLGAFGNIAASVAAGAAIGYLIAKIFGLRGDALIVTAIGGALTGIALPLLFNIAIGFAWLITVVIVVAIIALTLYLLEIGKQRKTIVDFRCLPWQPPVGGDNCERCGENGLPCSQYKCQSLGQSCELINEGTDGQLCVNINPNDVSPPIIKENIEAIGEDFEYSESEENVGVKVESKDSNDGCISEYAPVMFGVSLDEPGQCRISEIHTADYGEMSGFFGESNLYKKDHETIGVIPSLQSLGVGGIDPNRRGEYNLFVRCQDSSGNSNVQEYNVRFCVAPANDLTPPIITKFIPESPGYVKVNSTEKLVRFYTNEPAECKWSFADKDFELMENSAECINGLDDVTSLGWLCGANLPIIDGDETNYYFRCSDQPWFADDDNEENDSDVNINTVSRVYEIKKSLTDLLISFVSPDNDVIIPGDVPHSIDLEVHTSGGVDGSALCEFSFNGDTFIKFFGSGGEIHKQTFNALFEGNYDINLLCTDIADNVATGNSIFTIEVDDDGPMITRVYDQNGQLTIITDESSECAYSFESCSYNFQNGTLMSGSGLTHTTPFDQGLIHHIKCRDAFQNPSSCLIIRGGYS
jgi:hypothetical protein